MNSTLALLENELAAIQASLLSTIPNNEPLNIAHGNWSFPGVTRDDLIGYASSLIALIQFKQEIIVAKNEPFIADYLRRLTFLRANTIPQIWSGNAALATAAYISTMISFNFLAFAIL